MSYFSHGIAAGFGFAAGFFARPTIVKAYNRTAEVIKERKAKKAVTKEGTEEAPTVKESAIDLTQALGKAGKSIVASVLKKGRADQVEIRLEDGTVAKMSAADLAKVVDAESAALEALEAEMNVDESVRTLQ